MIAFRLLTLLVIVFGVASSHLPNTDDDNFAKLFKMMENLTNQQQELKVKVMDSLAIQNEKFSNFEVKVMDSLAIQNEKLSDFEVKVNEKLSNFEVKVMDSLAIQNEKLSNFEVKVDSVSVQNEQFSKVEGKIDQFQDSLTEQYDDIMVQLQVGQIDTINYYYGCDNSTTMPPTQPPTTTMPPTEPPATTMPPTQPPTTTMPPTEPPTTTMPPTQPPTTTMPPTQPPVNMKDCTELYSNGFTSEGVYEIKPENGEALSVYCQEGWTVIQKRSDDSVNYTKNMEEYGRGFGQIDGEHWLGLNAMNKLTEQGSYTIRFELEAFDGETAWAEYSNFHVSPGTDYTLNFDLGSYRGTAGDSLSYHHNNKFTTFDVDQDQWSESCSTDWGGNLFGSSGWWFYSCSAATTTAMEYGKFPSIQWRDFRDGEALKAAVMKIKRV